MDQVAIVGGGGFTGRKEDKSTLQVRKVSLKALMKFMGKDEDNALRYPYRAAEIG